MRVVKCKNGHFFDIDTYDKCPICDAASVVDNSVSKPSVESETRSSNSNVNADSKSSLRGFKRFFAKTNSPDTAPLENRQEEIDCKENVSAASYENNSEVIVEEDKTEAMFMPSVEEPDEEKTEAMFMPSVEIDGVTEDMYSTSAPREDGAYSVNPAVESLQDAIQQVSASDDGKTMSFFSAAINQANMPKKVTNPVVGWLVCVSGNHLGEAFVINSGMNSIGRSNSNNIVINKDGSVSREKHAFLIYEPKKREFYVKPGESSGLTYVNEDYITETKKIQKNDIIEVGGSKLFFVPLCSDGFSWEDYIQEKE